MISNTMFIKKKLVPTTKLSLCPKSKSTGFLFKCLLDSPEITSYLLQSMTLGKLHGGSVFSTDHSGTGSHFVWLIGYNVLYVIHHPEMMTPQLREEV